jgi:hypothetical protein
MSVKMRQRFEKMIARRLVLDAVHAGYAVQVSIDGVEDALPKPSTSVKDVLAGMEAFPPWQRAKYGFTCAEYQGFNYVSVFWGDDDAQPVRELTDAEYCDLHSAVWIANNEGS